MLFCTTITSLKHKICTREGTILPILYLIPRKTWVISFPGWFTPASTDRVGWTPELVSDALRRTKSPVLATSLPTVTQSSHHTKLSKLALLHTRSVKPDQKLQGSIHLLLILQEIQLRKYVINTPTHYVRNTAC
jgi:hypothetical protein